MATLEEEYLRKNTLAERRGREEGREEEREKLDEFNI